MKSTTAQGTQQHTAAISAVVVPTTSPRRLIRRGECGCSSCRRSSGERRGRSCGLVIGM
ncbi:hypothetical protein HanRHA438_Chr02g0089611 [Helianthus annuus]|nr:hypothetical protein HanRHA438_Chr02g0089611 [Helianthus annuus]